MTPLWFHDLDGEFTANCGICGWTFVSPSRFSTMDNAQIHLSRHDALSRLDFRKVQEEAEAEKQLRNQLAALSEHLHTEENP